MFGGLVAKSHPALVTPGTVACQAPLSVGFPRQEYWNGLPFPSPGGLPPLPKDWTQVAWTADSLLCAVSWIAANSLQLSHQGDQSCCCRLLTKSCLTLLQSNELYPARLLYSWGFLGKNTGVGCHLFLQRIFPTQGSNLRLLHYRQIVYHRVNNFLLHESFCLNQHGLFFSCTFTTKISLLYHLTCGVR